MIEQCGIKVDAISVGGLETCIQLPGFGVAFDIGRCPLSAVNRETVFFTHAHVDHMGGVITHCATRALRKMRPPTYAIPRENEAAFHDLLAAWRKLDASDLPCQVIPCGPGDEIRIRKDLVARPVRAVHRVPCQAYVLWQSRNRLRADLVGQPKEAIQAARARGETVSEAHEVPIFAFSGDTQIELLQREECVRKARLLMMEVTFMDDRVSVESARKMGHIHLDEVIENASIFENEHIVFTHLSARYRWLEAAKILEERLPANLKDRVSLLPRRQ